MFGLSFGELFVITLVALIVLGPERLPKVARTAGIIVGKIQRFLTDVKRDFADEMNLEEIKQLKTNLEQELQQPVEQVKQDAQKLHHDLTQGLSSVTSEPVSQGPAPATTEAAVNAPPPNATHASVDHGQ